MANCGTGRPSDIAPLGQAGSGRNPPGGSRSPEARGGATAGSISGEARETGKGHLDTSRSRRHRCHARPKNQFDTIMTVKSEVFPKAPYPNWTGIGVNWLAGFDFEIKVIARIPG